MPRTRTLLSLIAAGSSIVCAGIVFAFAPPATQQDPLIGSARLLVPPMRSAALDAASLLGSGADSWRGVRAEGPELSFAAHGAPLPIPGCGFLPNSSAALREFTRWANRFRAAWGLGSEVEFLPLNVWEFKEIWHISLQPAIGGVPIYGSRLDGKLNRDGFLHAVRARLFPSQGSAAPFRLTDRQALSQLTNDPSARLEFSRKIYYPLPTGETFELLPAWQILAATDQADFRPAGIVQAQTGEILLQYNDAAFDGVSGSVLGWVLPAYWDDEPQSWAQKNQWVNVVGQSIVYTNSSGNYVLNGLLSGTYTVQGKLQGLYVDVNNDDGPDAFFTSPASTGSPLNWTWNYDLARQDEVNMYYHVDRVHAYFKTLQNDFTALDFPLPATVGYGTGYENAFWNGSGIYFGTGGGTFRNFALFCDVIYHEYTHGVTDMIYPPGMLPYTGQPGAMNEGWSDYFACTITDEPLIGEGGLYVSGQVMRNLDNTLRYPDNWAGEVHADGRIFGGALWDLRERIGAGTADSLIHFAKYDLAESWEDYFLDVLELDDDDGNLANGGPHSAEIYEAFGLHGIGPGADPMLAILLGQALENGSGGSQGNGDGFYDPGEIVSIAFSVADSRYLYPPAAQGVTVAVTTDNPLLTLNPQSFELGDILPGATVAAPENLLITISPDAELSFTRLYFQITANGGSYQTEDEFEILIGHPQILLVDDDGGDHYQQFYDSALRAWGQVFSTYDVAASGPILLSHLNQFDAVIWLTGNEAQNTLTESDRAALAAFLTAGGNLLLSGQNLVEDIGSSAFFADYLKASPVAGSVNNYVLDGVPGDPISDSTWVMILGAESGNNQTSPGAVSALSGAAEIYHYRNDPQARAGAVRYDGGAFKTVTFAFGCEAVSGLASSTPRAEVLTSVLAWFGLETGVSPQPQAIPPTAFALYPPHPNPFNPTTTLTFDLPRPARTTLEIFDVGGRKVQIVGFEESHLQAGLHTITFDGSELPSGVYFAQLRAGEHTAVKKMVLMK